MLGPRPIKAVGVKVKENMWIKGNLGELRVWVLVWGLGFRF